MVQGYFLWDIKLSLEDMFHYNGMGMSTILCLCAVCKSCPTKFKTNVYVFCYLSAQEKQLEFSVVEILEASHAVYYIPVFARHRISIETLCNLLEDDLKQVRYCGPGGARKWGSKRSSGVETEFKIIGGPSGGLRVMGDPGGTLPNFGRDASSAWGQKWIAKMDPKNRVTNITILQTGFKNTKTLKQWVLKYESHKIVSKYESCERVSKYESCERSRWGEKGVQYDQASLKGGGGVKSADHTYTGPYR